jgi:hypothetical protein
MRVKPWAISRAARKFAEHIARRMHPMIGCAGKADRNDGAGSAIDLLNSFGSQFDVNCYCCSDGTSPSFEDFDNVRFLRTIKFSTHLAS